MDQTLTLRLATLNDLSGVDALLARSYPRLLRRDYPPSVMVMALPIITRARPALLASGRYYVVTDSEGVILGAGGWSMGAPAADGRVSGVQGGVGHVRHVACDPGAVRRGIGTAVMRAVIGSAQSAGVRRMDCLSTRTAVAFYTAQGFGVRGPEIEVALGPGIGFPAVPMAREI